MIMRSKYFGVLVGTAVLFSVGVLRAEKKEEVKQKPVYTRAQKIESISEEEAIQERLRLKPLGLSFSKTSKEYIEEVRALIRKRFVSRKRVITNSFGPEIKVLENERIVVLKKSIEYFQAFLKRHPNHPGYTPDAMFRLAELYYEDEKLNYDFRKEQFEIAERKYLKKEIPNPPTEPSVKTMFATTIMWLNRLEKRFPSYRYMDAAFYVLGFCHSEQEEDQKAIQYFREITDKYPKSSLVAEAWLRLGENYFSRRNFVNTKKEKSELLANAKAAYRKMLNYPKHRDYDKALYKLGWSHYLLDEFDKAVGYFVKVLEFYIQQKKTGNLNKESIQYIAESFSDDNWGSPEKTIDFVKKQGLEKKYSFGVLNGVAKLYYRRTELDKALKIYLAMRDSFPTHPRLPLIQERITEIYQSFYINTSSKENLALKLQYFKKLQKEKARITTLFAKDSVWLVANKENPEALANVQRVLRDGLYRNGLFRHELCQKFGDKKNEQKAIPNCLLAINYLEAFLERFPRSKAAYEITYRLADSNYFAKRYDQAMSRFKEVRDWPGEKEYFGLSATSYIDSIEKKIEALCQEKLLARGCPKPEGPKKKESKKAENTAFLVKKKLTPLKIHPLHQEALKAKALFLTKSSQIKVDSFRKAREHYDQGRIYFVYNHMDKARELFWEFSKQNTLCNTQNKSNEKLKKLVEQAGDTIVASFRKEGRLFEMTKALEQLKSDVCYQPGYAEDLKVGIMFAQAKQYQDKKQWVLAAKAFVDAVNKKPAHQEAPAGLWNAALMYRNANRYGSALTMYERIVKQYGPGSKLLSEKEREKGWKLADQAAFNLASNAEKFFQFERAIEEYNKLLRDYPDSKTTPAALFNSAIIMNNLQQYQRAAGTFKKYATRFKDRKDAPDAYWLSVLTVEKLKDSSASLQAYKSFIRAYSEDDSQAQRVLISYGKIMEIQEKTTTNKRALKKIYQQMIQRHESYASKVQKSGKQVPVEFAAKATYLMAMEQYQKLQEYKITTKDQKRQGQMIKKSLALYKDTKNEFQKTFPYKSAPWTLCSLFRIAEGFEVMAKIVRTTPLPKIRGVKWTVETKEIYTEKLDEKFIQPLEKQAKQLYLIATKRAQELAVNNECTSKAYINLNRLDARVQIPKKMLFQTKENADTPLPLLLK